MKKELSKLYEPNKVEDKIYKYWLDGGFFHAEPDSKKEPYCIVIPPPNITGQLHMVMPLMKLCRIYLSAGRE
jgi:valyl-tRNA synthetase